MLGTERVSDLSKITAQKQQGQTLNLNPDPKSQGPLPPCSSVSLVVTSMDWVRFTPKFQEPSTLIKHFMNEDISAGRWDGRVGLLKCLFCPWKSVFLPRPRRDWNLFVRCGSFKAELGRLAWSWPVFLHGGLFRTASPLTQQPPGLLPRFAFGIEP